MWMGIDGGGSNLRVVVVDEDMNVIAETKSGPANPITVGRDIAQQQIVEAIDAVLASVDRSIVKGVGIGIAGAEGDREARWLSDVVHSSLPNVPVVPSSDHEIALVGARGHRQGMLLLSGTGSIALGISEDGTKVQKGGWGYRFGDEGSGYWLGLHALKAIAISFDGLVPAASALATRTLDELGIKSRREILSWVYAENTDPAKVARLAPLVLEVATGGDEYALQIIEQAVAYLGDLGESILVQLSIPCEEVSFAGGLLETRNVLSNRLASRLRLPEFPLRRYTAVVGAALLAKLEFG